MLGWPKSSFGFTGTIKDAFFIFTDNFTEQCRHRFVPLSSATFRQLHHSIPKLFIVLSKEPFQVPLQSSRELKVFPLREFCKDWNKRKSEGAVSGEYSDESGLPSQAGTVFAWSSKKHAVSCYPDGRFCVFC